MAHCNPKNRTKRIIIMLFLIHSITVCNDPVMLHDDHLADASSLSAAVSSFGGIFFVMELMQWQSSIRTFSQIQLHTRHESKKFQ
jgi:predicted SpoU family rRNA methylase